LMSSICLTRYWGIPPVDRWGAIKTIFFFIFHKTIIVLLLNYCGSPSRMENALPLQTLPNLVLVIVDKFVGILTS